MGRNGRPVSPLPLVGGPYTTSVVPPATGAGWHHLRRAAWATWAKAAGVDLPASPLDRVFEHNSYMLEAAAAGLGVAVTPWAFAQPDIERGRLVAPLGFQASADRFAFLRPSLAENPDAEAFSEWLVNEGRRSAKPPGPLLPPVASNRGTPATGPILPVAVKPESGPISTS